MRDLLEQTKKYYEDMADIEKDPEIKAHYLKQVKCFEERIKKQGETKCQITTLSTIFWKTVDSSAKSATGLTKQKPN